MADGAAPGAAGKGAQRPRPLPRQQQAAPPPTAAAPPQSAPPAGGKQSGGGGRGGRGGGGRGSGRGGRGRGAAAEAAAPPDEAALAAAAAAREAAAAAARAAEEAARSEAEAKRRAEAEARRKEAAERRAKEEADARAKAEETLKLAQAKAALLDANKAPKRPDESALKLRDSSIKRNTALMKKLRAVTDDGLDALLRELRGTNLSKYVSEAAAALAEGRHKSQSAAWAAVEVASELHQTYAEFGAECARGLARLVPAAGAATAGDGGEPLPPLQRRLKLRFLTDLLLVGVISDPAPLLGVLKELSADSYVKDKEAYQTSLTLVASFAKHARTELLGMADAAAPPPPPPPAESAEAEAAAPPPVADGDGDTPMVEAAGGDDGAAQSPPPGPDATAAAAALAAASAVPRYAAPAPKAALFVAAVTRVHDAASAALESEHTALAAAERDAARALESRGELPEAAQAAYDRTRKAFEALLRGVSALAEALGKDPPAFPDDANVTRMAAAPGEPGRGTAPAPGPEDGPFEDDEQRSFYESLPELRAMVPAVLLGGAAPDAPPADAPAAEGADTAAAADASAQDAAAAAAADAAAAAAAEASSAAAESEERNAGGPALSALLSRLPQCGTREACDALALDFCYLNSRGARRRLVRELLAAPRNEPQLLPYYARVAAALAPVTPRDVAPPLVAALEDEGAALRARRDGGPLEARLRCARYLAELTKFRLAPPGSVLTWLKACLDDFNGANVDVAAALLEGCGRFLARSPESGVRANALIDVLGRLKQARNLDARQAALVDNAYLACRPPPRAPPRRAKERPPQQAFARHVIFNLLAPATVERCVRLLRRMAWTPENEAYLLKTALKVHKLRYTAVPAVAALLARLARFHDSLAVGAVDELLEAIRAGLEANSLAAQQRRVAHARLLGELHNQRLLPADGVLGALHGVLAYGYDALADGEAFPACDPPGDCSRVRLVVTMLASCGQRFDRGAAGAKLDRFLAYFQRYMLAKPALPLDQAFDVADLFALLRPRLKRHATFAEACAECAAIEAAEARAAAAAAAGAPPTVPEEPEDEEEDEESEGDDDDDDDDSADDAEAAAAAAEGGDTFDADAMEDEEDEEDEDGDEDEGDEDEDAAASSDSESEAAGSGMDVAGSLVPKEEADAFDRELSAFLGGDGGGGPLGLGGGGKGSLGALRPLSKGGALPVMSLSTSAPAATSSAAGGATVAFKMLTRRDGRSSTRELRVPVASEMATVVAAQQEAEEAERSELKRLVLDQVALSEGAADAADAAAHAPGQLLFSTGGARGGDRQRGRRQPRAS